jgi:NAD(P)-dependent dehydrogenase (short-subunit alcohol dehydrogenase family)
MAKKQTRKTAKKAAKKGAKKIVAAVKRAKKGRAAEVKPAKARAKADDKALYGKTKPWTPAEVEEAFRRFQAAMPEPKGELQHVNPFTLLVAVVLSAQATDAGVNKATPALFAVMFTLDGFRYPNAVASGRGNYFDLMRRAFLAKAQALGYEVIDLDLWFVASHAATGERFEFPDDDHWNSNGHKVAAEAVAASPLLARPVQ